MNDNTKEVAMTTRTFENMAAQGDLLIRRVASLPPGLTEAVRPEGGHIVAHSETGHHHVVREAPGATVRLYRPENDIGPEAGMVAYLEVLAEHADLLHLRSFDTHEPIRVPAGLYELRRQREWVPDGWRRVED